VERSIGIGPRTDVVVLGFLGSIDQGVVSTTDRNIDCSRDALHVLTDECLLPSCEGVSALVGGGATGAPSSIFMRMICCGVIVEENAQRKKGIDRI
jgi:hypothetical protein